MKRWGGDLPYGLKRCRGNDGRHASDVKPSPTTCRRGLDRAWPHSMTSGDEQPHESDVEPSPTTRRRGLDRAWLRSMTGGDDPQHASDVKPSPSPTPTHSPARCPRNQSPECGDKRRDQQRKTDGRADEVRHATSRVAMFAEMERMEIHEGCELPRDGFGQGFLRSGALCERRSTARAPNRRGDNTSAGSPPARLAGDVGHQLEA